MSKSSGKGSSLSKNLSLYFAITNRVAFTELFIAKAWSRKGMKVRYFHLPPMLSDDAVLLGGRSHGKSFAVLEPRIVQSMFIYPDEESVLSAYRKLHIKDRVENVVMILNKVPYFKAFIMNIRRDPHYDILLRNGHRFFGISVGDDPTAISIQGKHPKCLHPDQTVQTNVGKISIRKLAGKLKSGQNIMAESFNIETNQFTYNKILHVFKNPIGNRKMLQIIQEDGSGSKMTDNHPVYIYKNNKIEYVDARNLIVGDLLISNEPTLTEQQRSLCIGMAIGDGHIRSEKWDGEHKRRKIHKKAVHRIKINHSATHNEYVNFKLNILKDFVNQKTTKITNKVYENQYGHEKSSFSTRTDYEFTKISRMAYSSDGVDRKKIITKELLDGINTPALAIWYCDDGSMSKSKCGVLRDVQLHTQRYTSEEVERIKQWLNAKFSITASIKIDKRGPYYSIRLENRNGIKFLKMIAPYVPKYMAYKFACIELGDLKILGSDIEYWDRKDYINGITYQTRIVTSIDSISFKWNTVYNMEVEGNNNYISGGFLVKNCKFIEEAQAYPMHAWKQWQSTTHPAGCKELYCGVVDGRVDTPFKMLDTPGTTAEIDKFANKRFHIPRYFDPWWNEETKRDCIRNFGSENADEYLQQVKSQWGSPASSVWDTLAIFACMNKNNDCMRLDFDQNTIDEFTELSLPDAPKQSGPTRIAFGIDTGYTEPTEMAGFAYVGNKWKLFLILSMRNKIIYETQTEVINRVLSFYNASFAGVDSTSYPIISGMLKNPSGKFKDKEYGDRIVDVMFNENISYMMSGEERKQKTKSFSTDYLRSMFKKGQFDLPLDDELINNFNSEKLLTVKTGKIICTPERVHITDSFRCFVVAYFKLYTEDFTGENINRDTALPEMGHSGIFGNTWGHPQSIHNMLNMRRT